ncbi:MAG TPA: helix-turn-helix transcriptional regulator, partial [Actinoplanes sp.]|nr:helix-turn-helix transcriptional regulator [Actinoplanes sp.]
MDLLQRIRQAAENAGLHEYELAAVDDLLAWIDVEKQPLLAAELLVRRMHLRFLTGDEFFDVAGMHRAVQLAGADPHSPQYALAVAELADAELWHGLPTGAERARTAVRLARACGADRPLTYALVADVMGQVMRLEACDLDELPQGVVQADEARAAATRERDFFGFVHAALWAGNCIDYFTSAIVHERLSRCRDELVALDAPHPYIAWLNTATAAGLLLSGDWRGCEQLLRVALGSAPGRFADTDTRLTAALLACLQGRPAEARAHLGRAEELFAEQSGFVVLTFDAVRAHLAVAAGDTDSAVAAALAGLAQDIPPTLVEWLLPLAARALADDAQRRRDREADPGPAMARLHDLRQHHPHVVVDPGPGRQARLILRAMQALYDTETARCRQDPGAGEAWEHAAAACHTAGLPWDEAYARWRTAQTLLPHRADRRRAMAALRRAAELATDLNAAPLLADITALASSARVPLVTPPVSLPTDPTPYRLTPREREILGHVLAGRTYHEMARALVVSEKTISAHMSNMLRKTGVANRVELSQLAHRLLRSPPGG